MKMNQRMSALLRQADIPVPFVDDPALNALPIPALSEVGEFVLLKNNYERRSAARIKCWARSLTTIFRSFASNAPSSEAYTTEVCGRPR